MPERKPLNVEDIKRMYWNEEMSTSQIGTLLGYDQSTIFYFMKRHNISRRNQRDAIIRVFGNYLPSHEEIRRLYWDEKLTLAEIGGQFSCSHDTVRHFMIHHNIPRRSRAEASKLAVERGVYDKFKSAATLKMNAEEIRKMYVDEERSIPQIAKIYGSSNGALHNFMLKHDIPTRTLQEAARLCSGENSAHWKGGRDTSQVYIRISKSLLSDAEQKLFKPMLDTNRYSMVQEHRIIMARFLGRSLKENEVVHHFNGIKHDNRLENLVLMKNSEHQKYIPALKRRIRELEKRISELEAEKQLHLELTGG